MLKKILYSKWTRKIYELAARSPLINSFVISFANKESLKFLEHTKNQLDQIGPGMCAAKWLQSSLHLEIGKTHSCHHPIRHSIDFDSLKNDIRNLHNTDIKRQARTEMIDGKRPSECEYCWKVEDLGDYSDRIYKSSSLWAQESLEKLKTKEMINSVNPTYLEVSFSSDCNLKCAYCYPEVSSSIRHEIEKFGHYPTSDKFQNLYEYQNSTEQKNKSLKNENLNEYFWQWWESGLADHLQVLRVTGGEPLLSKDLFILMNKLDNDQQKRNLDLSVNSNLMVGSELVTKFISLANKLVINKNIKKFSLYTSIDTWGEHAEYLRYGLKIKNFVDNIEQCLTVKPDLELVFMVTYQALSPFNFNQFLEFILNLRMRFPKAIIKVGISNITNPSFLATQILPPDFEKYLKANLNFMQERKLTSSYPQGFSQYEIQHLERILNTFRNSLSSWSIQKEDFVQFINEYDRRKKTSFKKTFSNVPELISLDSRLNF